MALNRDDLAHQARLKANRLLVEVYSKRNLVNIYEAQNEEPQKSYRKSQLDSSLALNEDYLLIHVTGNNQQRAIFVECFDLHYSYVHTINRDHPNQAGEFIFESQTVGLLEMRKQFRTMGSYYLGLCVPTHPIAGPNYLSIKPLDRISQIRAPKGEEIDPAINKLICDIINDIEGKEVISQLSVFTPEQAKPIKSQKTYYDTWLEKWYEEDRRFSSYPDENLRRALSMLFAYSCGENSNTLSWLFSGEFLRHHRATVARTLTPYLLTGPSSNIDFEPIPSGLLDSDEETSNSLHTIEATKLLAKKPKSQQSRSISLEQELSAIHEGKDIPLDNSEFDGDALEEVALTEEPSLIEIEKLLRALKEAIESTNTAIKPHGELAAILQVIKDLTGVDYNSILLKPAFKPSPSTY